ncbi:MAG: hypothetical protein RLZ44_839 [Pseudomonadota bacterium]|jgi:uncharacterized protein (DUF302 family)
MGIRGIMLTAVTLVVASMAHASEGLQTMVSRYSVEQTMNRLERAVRVAGFRVFARIDHSRAADRVDIRLRPTQLLIFGKPEAGSVLLQSDQRMGIDLPVKYLVWLDAQGQVQVGWNEPAWLGARHGVTDRAAALEGMSNALRSMAEDATGAGAALGR